MDYIFFILNINILLKYKMAVSLWASIAKNKVITIIFLVIILVLTITTIVGGFIFGWLIYLNSIKKALLAKKEASEEIYEQLKLYIKDKLSSDEVFDLKRKINKVFPIKSTLSDKNKKTFTGQMTHIFSGKKDTVYLPEFDVYYKYIISCMITQVILVTNINKLITEYYGKKVEAYYLMDMTLILSMIFKIEDSLKKYGFKEIMVVNTKRDTLIRNFYEKLTEILKGKTRQEKISIPNIFKKDKLLEAFDSDNLYINKNKALVIAFNILAEKNIDEYLKSKKPIKSMEEFYSEFYPKTKPKIKPEIIVKEGSGSIKKRKRKRKYILV